MYRVEQRDRETWVIVEEGDNPLFAGTQRQCEDWLDHQQNLERLANRTSIWKRLTRWLWKDRHRRPGERPSQYSRQSESSDADSSSEVESSPAA